MASKKQKQELIQTLKFTPKTVTIQIQGYGGECYIGSVGRDTYEFFKAKKIDIEQYAMDWDGEMFDDVPKEHRFFTPGNPYDCDDLFHGSGATMDDASEIEVIDEDNNTIWASNLDPDNLRDRGVTVDLCDDFDSETLDDGSVIYWGGQGEKGCFFSGEITLRAPWDPAKLRISYGNGDGWLLSSGVEYDGDDVEGFDGYSTTGKWNEYKFHIVGDEEVYQGEERSEDDDEDEDDDGEQDDDQASTSVDQRPYQDPAIHPGIKGEYDVLIKAAWPLGGPDRAEWTGRSWKKDGKKVEVSGWRTTAETEQKLRDDLEEILVDIPVLENEEMWRSRVLDEYENNTQWAGKPLTPWWSGNQTPEREGTYQVMMGTWPFPCFVQWSRKKGWLEDGRAVDDIKQWRGLAEPAD